MCVCVFLFFFFFFIIVLNKEKKMFKQWIFLFILVYIIKPTLQQYSEDYDLSLSPAMKSTLQIFGDKGNDECPPCFNCMLPGFECLHFANCSQYDGKCSCPPGFGGDDCRQPCK